jgi:hypothetical protein
MIHTSVSSLQRSHHKKETGNCSPVEENHIRGMIGGRFAEDSEVENPILKRQRKPSLKMQHLDENDIAQVTDPISIDMTTDNSIISSMMMITPSAEFNSSRSSKNKRTGRDEISGDDAISSNHKIEIRYFINVYQPVGSTLIFADITNSKLAVTQRLFEQCGKMFIDKIGDFPVRYEQIIDHLKKQYVHFKGIEFNHLKFQIGHISDSKTVPTVASTKKKH